MPDPNFRRAPALVFAGLCALALAAGCGGHTRAYAPTAASAREALDAALATWQQGGRPDDLASDPRPVHVVDAQWQAGQPLQGYEILGEEPGEGDNEKRFSVLLKMKKPPGERRVQYILVGRDPVWVFRDDDYARTSNMGDNPRPKRQVRKR